MSLFGKKEKEEIARLKDLSVEAIVFQTTTNACNIYKIEQ